MKNHNETSYLTNQYRVYVKANKRNRSEYKPSPLQAQIYTNENPVDINPEICLNCTEPHCDGSEGCYKRHGGKVTGTKWEYGHSPYAISPKFKKRGNKK